MSRLGSPPLILALGDGKTGPAVRVNYLPHALGSPSYSFTLGPGDPERGERDWERQSRTFQFAVLAKQSLQLLDVSLRTVGSDIKVRLV